MTGSEVIQWTIWAALGLYCASVVVSLRRPKSGRDLFTLGLIAYTAHVVAVFQFFHNWSHAAAYEYTARRTAEVTGVEYGGGVYVNYVFSLLWCAEAAWWWLAPRSYEGRARWLHALVHAVFVFMIFNATVVFGTGAVRWYGGMIAAISVIAMALVVRHPHTPTTR